MNHSLKDMFVKIISDNQSNWVPKAVFAYHVSVNQSTPYFVNFGRSPQLPVDVMFGTSTFTEDANIPQFIIGYASHFKHHVKPYEEI